jgi:hypothetical protein
MEDQELEGSRDGSFDEWEEVVKVERGLSKWVPAINLWRTLKDCGSGCKCWDRCGWEVEGIAETKKCRFEVVGSYRVILGGFGSSKGGDIYKGIEWPVVGGDSWRARWRELSEYKKKLKTK